MPSLSPRNLAGIEIEKKFMLSHGYIKHDFDLSEWSAPQFAEQAVRELVDEQFVAATPEERSMTAPTAAARKGSLEESELRALVCATAVRAA